MIRGGFCCGGGPRTERRAQDMAQGTVKWFSEDKGYGFISPNEGIRCEKDSGSLLFQAQRRDRSGSFERRLDERGERDDAACTPLYVAASRCGPEEGRRARLTQGERRGGGPRTHPGGRPLNPGGVVAHSTASPGRRPSFSRTLRLASTAAASTAECAISSLSLRVS